MATVFNLVKKTKVNYENRDCEVYTYQSSDKIVKFFLHPTQSFSFMYFKDTNVPVRLRNKVADAFLTAGSQAYGDKQVFAKNIKTLTVA